MPDHEHAYPGIRLAVDHRVRINTQWKRSTACARWCSKPGIGLEQPRNPFKFFQKAPCNSDARFDFVVVKGVGEIAFRQTVNRPCHGSSERNLARTSSIETSIVSPDSMSASRRPAMASHAALLALSASRLATTRSSNLARSAAGSRRTSLSRASRGSDIAFAKEFGWRRHSLPQLAPTTSHVASLTGGARLTPGVCRSDRPVRTSSPGACQTP